MSSSAARPRSRRRCTPRVTNTRPPPERGSSSEKVSFIFRHLSLIILVSVPSVFGWSGLDCLRSAFGDDHHFSARRLCDRMLILLLQRTSKHGQSLIPPAITIASSAVSLLFILVLCSLRPACLFDTCIGYCFSERCTFCSPPSLLWRKSCRLFT